MTLSEFLAWVRYLAAITPNDDKIKLTQSFATLDPHQKTILSDDFEKGVSMLQLWDTLSFDLVVDGTYFMRQHVRTVGVPNDVLRNEGPTRRRILMEGIPEVIGMSSNAKAHSQGAITAPANCKTE
ncbi:hypothetical protein [Pseudomonas corrugata]|uniref:hypothetical protein n=1 Tax=Pseudomonas corrugata TaxID=47879 RepID=UPI00158629D6|nr:hypothetical protein [Pseudomonas corrugata]MCI0995179.1 hypothetical protein [Pseudomonas corrugata]NUT64668.1 hypothetical protein [Pseudomonas corrugata]